MRDTHLMFNTAIGKNKPESIRNKTQSCPFCARSELTNIIAEDGEIILLKNKFPVLENAFQTVLIETDDCHNELSLYTREHLVKLLEFGLSYWLKLETSGEFASVLFLKNHGPLSGGTIAHPHMQIIGLNDINYRSKVSLNHFHGHTIAEQSGVIITLSSKPQIGFYEFSVRMVDRRALSIFADYLQKIVHYILNGFPFCCTSYNLFFYHIKGDIVVKIVPRFVTTGIFIGYFIPQVPNNLEWMVGDIQSRYF